MTETLTSDLCVIGAGSGGLSVAAAAALLGVPVVLIEKHKMGGDCLNTGCVPSKALIAAAARAHHWKDAAAFGVVGAEPRVDFASVHAHVHDVISSIAPNDSVARFKGLGVRVVQDAARFVDVQTVQAGDVTVRARRFIIATGSSAALPPIPGLAQTPHLTNETIFDLTQCPGHLIVIGAGPIGLEMAQAFRRLGAQETVIEAAAPLAKDDPECSQIVVDALRSEGVAIRAGVKALSVEGTSGEIRVTIEESGVRDMIAGTHLLVAAGRKPNVEGLNLEAAGIAYDRRGIAVDRALRTSNKKIYAIGDVAGGLQFTHVANDHAGLVIRHALFRLPVDASKRIVPWVTYTEPELAHVGLSEMAAREKGWAIRVLRWPFHENDRAQAERQTHGHIKIVTDKRGKILGATIVGAHAGELLAPWTLAINQGLKIGAMTGVIAPYPTLGEVGKRAAITAFLPLMQKPMLRRVIGCLRRLG